MDNSNKHVRFQKFMLSRPARNGTFDTVDLASATDRWRSQRATNVAARKSSANRIPEIELLQQLSYNDIKILWQIVQGCDTDSGAAKTYPHVDSIYERVLGANGIVNDQRFDRAMELISKLEGVSWRDRFETFVFQRSQNLIFHDNDRTLEEDSSSVTPTKIKGIFFDNWRRQYLNIRYHNIYTLQFYSSLKVVQLKQYYFSLWVKKLVNINNLLNRDQLSRNYMLLYNTFYAWVSAQQRYIGLDIKARILNSRKVIQKVMILWKEHMKWRIMERLSMQFQRHYLLVPAFKLWKSRHSHNEMLGKMVDTSAKFRPLNRFFITWRLQTRMKGFQHKLCVKLMIQILSKWRQSLVHLQEMQRSALVVHNVALRSGAIITLISLCKRSHQLNIKCSSFYNKKLMKRTLGIWKNNLLLSELSHKFISSNSEVVVNNFFNIWRNIFLDNRQAGHFSNQNILKSSFQTWSIKAAEIKCVALLRRNLKRKTLKKWQLLIKCNDVIEYRDLERLNSSFSVWVNKTHDCKLNRSTLLAQYIAASKERCLRTFFKTWEISYRLIKGKEFFAKGYSVRFSKDRLLGVLVTKYNDLLYLQQQAADHYAVSLMSKYSNIWSLNLRRSLQIKAMEQQAVNFIDRAFLMKGLKVWRNALNTKKYNTKLVSMAIDFNDKYINHVVISTWRQKLKIKQAKNRNRILKSFLISKKQDTLSKYLIIWREEYHNYELDVEKAENLYKDNSIKLVSLYLDIWIKNTVLNRFLDSKKYETMSKHLVKWHEGYHNCVLNVEKAERFCENNSIKMASICLNNWISEAHRVLVNKEQAQQIYDQNLRQHYFIIMKERWVFLKSLITDADQLFNDTISRRQEAFYKIWAMKAFKLKNRLLQANLFKERFEASKIRRIWRLWKLKSENNAYIKQALLSPTKPGNLNNTRLVERNHETPRRFGGPYTPFSSNNGRILKETPQTRLNLHDNIGIQSTGRKSFAKASSLSTYPRRLYSDDSMSGNLFQNADQLSSILQTPTRVKGTRIDSISVERWKRSEVNRFLNMRINNEPRLVETEFDSSDNIEDGKNLDTTSRVNKSPLPTSGTSRFSSLSSSSSSRRSSETKIDYSNDPKYLTPELG